LLDTKNYLKEDKDEESIYLFSWRISRPELRWFWFGKSMSTVKYQNWWARSLKQ